MSHNNISTVIYALNKKITVTKRANPDLAKKIKTGIARAQKLPPRLDADGQTGKDYRRIISCQELK